MILFKRVILLAVLVFSIALPCSTSAKEGTMIEFDFVVDDILIHFSIPSWYPSTGNYSYVDMHVTTPTGLKFGIFFRKNRVNVGSTNVLCRNKDTNYRCMISANHAISKKVDLSVLPKPYLNAWNEMRDVSGRLSASNKFWEMISPHFTGKEKKVLKKSLEEMKDGKYVPFVMEKGKGRKGYSRTISDVWSFIDTGNLCVGYGFGYTAPIQAIVDDNKIHLITYSGVTGGVTDKDPDRVTLYKDTKEYRIWLESDRTSEELLQLFKQELKTTREKIFSLHGEKPPKDLLDVIRESLIGIETYTEKVHNNEVFKPESLRVPSGT